MGIEINHVFLPPAYLGNTDLLEIVFDAIYEHFPYINFSQTNTLGSPTYRIGSPYWMSYCGLEDCRSTHPFSEHCRSCIWFGLDPNAPENIGWDSLCTAESFSYECMLALLIELDFDFMFWISNKWIQMIASHYSREEHHIMLGDAPGATYHGVEGLVLTRVQFDWLSGESKLFT